MPTSWADMFRARTATLLNSAASMYLGMLSDVPSGKEMIVAPRVPTITIMKPGMLISPPMAPPSMM